MIDLLDSSTLDGITTGGGSEEGGLVWEWEWDCFVPREANGRGGGVCEYEGGEVIEMPGRGEGVFVGGGGGRVFEVGVPLYFVVRVRVREVGGFVIAEGYFEKVFSVIEEQGSRRGRQEEENNGIFVIEQNEWICEGGAVGYSVTIFFFFLRMRFNN